MGAWAKLASRVAYRKGTAKYCGYKNEVNPGMWYCAVEVAVDR